MAKREADLANATVTQVADALRPIKEQLDQWQQSYGNANTSNEDINKALMEANKTGRTVSTCDCDGALNHPGDQSHLPSV